MKNYKEFIVSFIPFNSELVSGALWDLDIAGINELDTSLTVFALEDSEVKIEDFNSILSAFRDENLIETFNVTQDIVENRNWNEEWEKKVRVIEVTDKIVIKPSFKEYTPKEGQVIIKIDPKMSFGTGEHQTTKLVLTYVEKYIQPGDTVLDVGCGTGILAIGAVLLGAESAIGVDNDEWCLLNGNENVALNGLEGKVKIVLGETGGIEEKEFDLILANINKHILLDIKDNLFGKLKASGTLILSGLLTSDEEVIVDTYSAIGLNFIEKSTMDEWISLVFRK